MVEQIVEINVTREPREEAHEDKSEIEWGTRAVRKTHGNKSRGFPHSPALWLARPMQPARAPGRTLRRRVQPCAQVRRRRRPQLGQIHRRRRHTFRETFHDQPL
jgi:hypothetical protein